MPAHSSAARDARRRRSASGVSGAAAAVFACGVPAVGYNSRDSRRMPMTMSQWPRWRVWFAGRADGARGRGLRPACPTSRTKRPAGRRSNSTATRTRRCSTAIIRGPSSCSRRSRRAIRTAASRSRRCSRARSPIGAQSEQAAATAALRPLHPHVSQPPERRLRVLPERPRLFPRGPGTVRLRVRARPLRARSEVDARVVRRVQGARAEVSRQPLRGRRAACGCAI